MAVTFLFNGVLIALNRTTGAIVYQHQLPASTNAPIAVFGNTVLVPAGSGLIVMPNPLNSRNSEVIAGLAARLYLPAIYPFHLDSEKGGLVSYGFDTIEQQRGIATYVSRILKGEKPADLPVVQAAKFELVINHPTARMLGVEVPDRLLALADEVIE